MKVSFLIGIAGLVAKAFSASGSDEEPTSLINDLDVQIVFPESPLSEDGLVTLINEQESPLKFYVTNGESSPLIIAGYGGAVYDKKQPDVPYANLSTTSISPVKVEPGETAEIAHAVRVALPPKEFDIEFTLYTSLNDEIVRITLSKRPVAIEDPPVSSWDPKLLFVQVILGITAVVGGYFASTKFVLPLIEENMPASMKPAVADDKKKKKQSVTPPPANGKKYDESWIPDHHLRKKKA